MSRSLLRIAALAVLLLRGAPAVALGDLTGTYEGSFSCEATSNLETAREKVNGTLYVDDANNGEAFAYLNNSGLFFRLGVFSPGSADGGALGGPSCTMSSAAGGDLLWATVKAKEGSDQASLRGELITTNLVGLVQVCRFSLKRTSTNIPESIPDCP